MKIIVRLLLIELALVQITFAQTESFDIATFVRPMGWSRNESNGVLILQHSEKLLGQPKVCQIYLLPSRPSNADPMANFRRDWDAMVARPLGVTQAPAPQQETAPDGWTTVTVFADAMTQGLPLSTILLTITGFGKSVSVVVKVTPKRS
jgi:hypothetical protein